MELNYKVLNTIMFFYNWVKVIYVGSSATIKRDEYDFTFVNFNSFIPFSNASFVFPIHIEQVFFSKDPKEKGWKVILQKDPLWRCVIGSVETNPINLDMFRIDNADRYIGLQALVFVPKSIQKVIVVGGLTITSVDLVVDGDVGMIDNNANNLKECGQSSSSNNDGN